MSTSTGYNCKSCGKWHAYTPYMIAHQGERVQHRCDLCGAVHMMFEGAAYLWSPGHTPRHLPDQREQLVAAAAQVPLFVEPALTDWITDEPPQRDGFYHIRFPNGTESDRNWYWNSRGQRFAYDTDSPITLGFSSIGAWRGLDREYN